MRGGGLTGDVTAAPHVGATRAVGVLREHVLVPAGGRIEGAILVNHLKSLDWKERRAQFAGRIDAATLDDVRERIRPLLGL